MYTVVLRREDEQPIHDVTCDTVREARQRARMMITNEWAVQHAESTHDAMGTRDVVVLNGNGECVKHYFRASEVLVRTKD